jgi:aminoglycoside phosphotransferase (APT) family kinase protein
MLNEGYLAFESRRRNRNFSVFTSAQSFFVKQLPAIFPEAVDCLRRESFCYQQTSTNPELAVLKTWMNAYVDHDPERHVLITEYLRDAENLHEMHARMRAYSITVAQALGEALGSLHRASSGFAAMDGFAVGFPKTPPWALTIGQDASLELASLPGGHRQVLLRIRELPALLTGLTAVRDAWRCDEFIHGDIRGDNILVSSSPDGSALSVHFVDWELADIGDQAWDVASMLATYLEYWLFTPPVQQRPELSRESSIDTESHKQIRVALAESLRSYVKTRQLSDESARGMNSRLMPLLAARLVRSAFDAVAGMDQISHEAMTMLEIAQFALANPDRAYAELLGIDN